MSHDPRTVSLVEVKYRSRVDIEEIRKSASEICEKWKLAWLFIATPAGFYFDTCTDLIEADARPMPLSTTVIPQELQSKYLQLLNEFIQ